MKNFFNRIQFFFSIVLLTAWGAAAAQWPSAATIRSATGYTGGLCVMVGIPDGAVAADLTQGETALVVCLDTDAAAIEAARAAIRAKDRYGLASAQTVLSLSTLPFPAGFVDLVVADLDAPSCKNLTDAAIDRVLAAGKGVAYTHRGGSWTVRKKPVDSGKDEWRQHFYGPDMNPVSHDKDVTVPRTLQWVGWYGNVASNGEGLHGPNGQGIRVAGGRAIQVQCFGVKGTVTAYYIDARNAYNGLGLWMRKASINRPRTHRPILTDDRYFVVTSQGTPGGYLQSLRTDNGELDRVFPFGNQKNGFDMQSILLENGLMVQTCRESLTVYDPTSGNVKWRWVDPQKRVLGVPTGSSVDNRLFVGIGAPGEQFSNGRDPHIRMGAIAGFDLSNGSKIWECSEFVGKGGGKYPYPGLHQLVYARGQGTVVAFGDLTYGDPYLGAIRTSDGKLLWQNDYQMREIGADDPRNRYQASGNDLSRQYWLNPGGTEDKWYQLASKCAVRDGRIYILSKHIVGEFDMNTGSHTVYTLNPVVNNRCHSPVLTDNLIVVGFSQYIDRNRNWVYTNISRSTCGNGITPACGLVYTAPNGECGCFTRIRASVALNPEESPSRVADMSRLVRGSAYSRALSGSGEVVNSVVADPYGFVGRAPVLDKGPIVGDWINNDYLPYPETGAAVWNSDSFVGVVNQHRVERRNAGKVAWSFTAGGRISRPPAVTRGMVLFGCHDGWVYCLDASDGAMRWRFLAARAERLVMAHSQIESASPVFNVVLLGGKACVSAGRHAEIDGGIAFWGLDPANGAIAWKGEVATRNDWVPAKSTKYRSYVNRILNTPLLVDNEQLRIAGAAFDPADPPAVGAKSKVPLSAPEHGITVSMAHGMLMIRGPGLAEMKSASVYTLSGRKVLEATILQGERLVIPTAGLNAGRYLLSLSMPGGGPTTLKFLVAPARAGSL